MSKRRPKAPKNLAGISQKNHKVSQGQAGGHRDTAGQGPSNRAGRNRGRRGGKPAPKA